MTLEIKTLTITVDFSNGIEMEDNLNKAIDELSSVIKRKGLINMSLEGHSFESLTEMYKVEIQDKAT